MLNLMLRFTFFDLKYIWHISLRKKVWNRLEQIDKSFFIACLKLSRLKPIKNIKVIETLKSLINKMFSVKYRILKAGADLAQKLLNSNVAKYFPQIKELVKDIKYIFWLGLTQIK